MAKTFEQSIAELEEIVEQLENGDVTLDESLGLFEITAFFKDFLV